MSFTNFDRHASMTAETRSEILEIIREIQIHDDLDIDTALPIENMLYGLFDGYLYEDIQLYALQLPDSLAIPIMRIYDICNRYPKTTSA